MQADMKREDEDFLGDIAGRLAERKDLQSAQGLQEFSDKALQLEVEDKASSSWCKVVSQFCLLCQNWMHIFMHLRRKH